MELQLQLDPKAVLDFLSERLQLKNWELEKLRGESNERKVNFLKDFVLAYGHHIYYQNVSWSAMPKDSRQIPTEDEVVETGLRNSGGTCIHLNYFIKLILEKLGFQVIVVGANSPLWQVPNSHLITIVRLPKIELEQEQELDKDKDELYLIDMGYGRPFVEPIPLHSLPFKSKAGGYPYEFRFNGENQTFERVVYDGCSIHGKLKEAEGGRRLDYFFHLKPMKFRDFDGSMTPIFTDPIKSNFLNAIFLFRLSRANSPGDFEYVCCHGKTMIEGSRDFFLETEFPSYDLMLPHFKKHFPNLRWEEVMKAVENYKEYDDKKKEMESNNTTV